MAEPRPVSPAGLAIGAALLVIAAIVAVDAARMQVPPSYARIGPQIFPYVIALCLAAIGAYFAWNAWAPGQPREIAPDTEPTDWRSPLIVTAGLLLHLMLLKLLGFIIVSAILFAAVAIAFGSRHYIRDGIIALALAAAAYFGFTRLLDLQLPAGLLAGVI